jgi:hydrogenase maturation protease
LDFKETSWGGFRIIDLLREYDYAVIVDSIKTGTSLPGYIHHLKTSDLLHTLRLNSYHDINFISAIKLAESLDEKMPADIDILAVEIRNNFTISENLSDEIKKSIVECSCRVLDLLKCKNAIDDDFSESLFNEIETEEDLKFLYDEKKFDEITN